MLPMTAAPMAHVRSRVVRKGESAAALAFILGYLCVWFLAALPLVCLAILLRNLAPDPWLPLLVALSLALLWQAMPARQIALNKCHGRPALPGFGRSPLGASLGCGIGPPSL